jgi:lipoprotein-anchoring transpeptidase ErfK/SrfK
LNNALMIKVKRGSIKSVHVTNGHGVVPGHLVSHGTAWVSEAPRLIPAATYAAEITLVGESGETTSAARTITTEPAKGYLTATMSPNAAIVGVGQPILIEFDRPVPRGKRDAVESALQVTTEPAVLGAWHWFDSSTTHWRPPTYWKPGTRVSVSMDISHVYFGKGLWGMPGKHTVNFTVGDALVSMVSASNHVMDVYKNGELVRTLPISAGQAKYPTMGGIHVTLDKTPSVIMDAATVGIPEGHPDHYYRLGHWILRISDGGAYVHASPRSIPHLGIENVSHGCVNLHPDDAEWFYDFSHDFGDIVDIDSPQRAPSSTDSGTKDWNMSWKEWLSTPGITTRQVLGLARHPQRLLSRVNVPSASVLGVLTTRRHRAHLTLG